MFLMIDRRRQLKKNKGIPKKRNFEYFKYYIVTVRNIRFEIGCRCLKGWIFS